MNGGVGRKYFAFNRFSRGKIDVALLLRKGHQLTWDDEPNRVIRLYKNPKSCTVVLNKPPIVEMWIEFAFDPGPNPTWDNAVSFLKEFHDEFKKLEISKEEMFEFRQLSPNELPKVVGHESSINHIRVHNKDETRWLHVTAHQLVCNFVRLGENYPGFELLNQEAVAKLKRYVEICEPTGLKFAAIHYVDVIEVPLPESGEILLSDYFRIGVELPKEPFGNQLSFSTQMDVRPTDETGDLEIQMQSEPWNSQASTYRFRMDWHKVIKYDGRIDFDKISGTLFHAHKSVMQCFRAVFTDLGWNLFDPEE